MTSKGYRVIMCPAQKRFRMEHIVVWETAHGPLPDGMQVHHINEDKLDNRIENLQALSPLDHRRTHSGCEMRDGEWWKPCCKCKTFYHIDHYYKRGVHGVSPWCRQCCIKNAIETKRVRKDAARQTRASAPTLA